MGQFSMSLRFITKVMFLVAIARPRFNKASEVVFNGKFGTSPFVVKELQREAANVDLKGH
jgi:hypothetical protein